jgi:hypothetical protein
LRLQANAIIDAHVFREGDNVDVGFAPSDGVLLGEDDRRLVGACPILGNQRPISVLCRVDPGISSSKSDIPRARRPARPPRISAKLLS